MNYILLLNIDLSTINPSKYSPNEFDNVKCESNESAKVELLPTVRFYVDLKPKSRETGKEICVREKATRL